MRMRGILLAVASMVLARCTGYVPCIDVYKTEWESNESDVDISIEGPGLESAEWDLLVNLTDRPEEGWDQLRIMLSREGCSVPTIDIEFLLSEEGVLEPQHDGNLRLEEPCPELSVYETWDPVPEGTVTFERSNGWARIQFHNLVILNPEPLPPDPPGLTSITMNGEYRAPVSCMSAS